MQKILVPTDFSDCAQQALDYAIAIANRFGGAITLYHVFKMRVTSRSFVNVDSLLKEEAEERIHRIIEEVEPRLSGGASISGVAMKGSIVMSISHRAVTGQYDLIVMGTEGTSEIVDLIMGSTTVGVIEEVTCPVLAVPQTAPYDGIHSIVFAIDEKGVSDINTLMPLVQLSQAFHIPIKVYHKADPRQPAEVEAVVGRLFENIPHLFFYETSEHNTTESILEYAKGEKADLVCLIRKKRDFLEKLFHTSVTRENVLRSHVPMLVLKE